MKPEFTYDREQGRSCLKAAGVRLEGFASATCGVDGHSLTVTTADLHLATWGTEAVENVHGRGERLRAIYEPGSAGLGLTLLAETYDDRPFLLLRVILSNHGPRPVAIERLTPFRSGPGNLHLGPSPLVFVKNGWQSWSYAGLRRANQCDVRPHPLLRPFAAPMLHNAATPISRKPGHFWGELVGMMGDVEAGRALVAGFVSTAEQFGVIETSCTPGRTAVALHAQCDGVELATGAELASEWAYLQFLPLPACDPLADYAEAAARQMQARVPSLPPPGWSSWYYFYQKVTEADVLSNLAAIQALDDTLPLGLVQLDQGYEPAWGDWLDRKSEFPHDLGWLAEQICAAGRVPGLWLSPLLVWEGCRLAREHPHWILRDQRGRPVSGGFVWKFIGQGLDPTHPEVQDYLRELIGIAVHRWGYRYLKLDFLYAGALPGVRHDATKTRAQALRGALATIRETAGDDVFLLGCGCPLGPAIGLLDSMRIGPDTGPHWNPRLFGLQGPFRSDPSIPALRNSLRNTLNRSWMHHRWWINDPENLMVRDQGTALTHDEVQAQATVIGLSGGQLVISDDLPRLTPEQREVAAALTPLSPPSRGEVMSGAQPLDMLEREMPELYVLRVRKPWEEWLVAGLFNWSDEPADRTLDLARLGLDPARSYHVHDFWRRRYHRVDDGRLVLDHVPPHGGHCLAVRPLRREPHLVATTFHITQGGEVVEWVHKGGWLRFTLELGRTAEGEVLLWLPVEPQQAICDGMEIRPALRGPGLWALPLRVEKTARVEVSLRELRSDR